MKATGFQVKSRRDASQALSYYNDFHDSFLEEIIIKTIPETPDGFAFGLPVRYEATLCLLHSNYPAASRYGPHRRRIEMCLGGIGSLKIGDIVPLDNMLQACCIEIEEDNSIHLDVGGDGIIEFTCDSLFIQEIEHENRD